MTSLHAMAQDLGSIWVDWEAPSLLPQGYLIEWGPDSHKYSNNSWRIEPNGNTTGILLEGKTGLGQRDGLRDRKKKQSVCLEVARDSWNLPIEAVSPAFFSSSSPYSIPVLALYYMFPL